MDIAKKHEVTVEEDNLGLLSWELNPKNELELY